MKKVFLVFLISLLYIGSIFGQTSTVYKGGPATVLTWVAPVQNDDGSVLTDLTGFHIGVYLTSQDPNDKNIKPIKLITIGPSTTQVRMTDVLLHLQPNTYRVVVSAFDSVGNDSGWATSVDVDIFSNNVKSSKPLKPSSVACKN